MYYSPEFIIIKARSKGHVVRAMAEAYRKRLQDKTIEVEFLKGIMRDVLVVVSNVIQEIECELDYIDESLPPDSPRSTSYQILMKLLFIFQGAQFDLESFDKSDDPHILSLTLKDMIEQLEEIK